MTDKNFVLVSLEDSKSKAISEVLGSGTCKKIIGYLSKNKEASQKDLSDALKLPMNTLDYNMKKLLDSGFVQKRKNFFWSKKGKKIIMYELSNKSIIISPRKSSTQKIKSILPAFILAAAGTFAVWAYETVRYSTETLQNSVADSSQKVLSGGAEMVVRTADDSINYLMTPHPTPLWIWFLAGALLVLVTISIVNWRKL